MKHSAWMSRPWKEKKGFIECLACNHRCKIAEEKTGICGVRKNEKGELKLLVYGKAAAQNLDPIEKKPLYHFYPGTNVFSIGTMGCNFSCTFCQNWDIAQFHKDHSTEEIENAGEDLFPEDIVNFCLERDIPSVSFTYNEPGIFFEYAYDVAKLAHKKGLKTVYVSNGFETQEALSKILPYLDAINIDLKSFQDEYYRKICGGRIEPVKENIKWCWDKGMWVEITTLVVTNKNDTEEELRDIAEFLAGISPNIPWHISRYHPAYMMEEPSTPVEILEKAYDIGKKAGLRYVYVGNVVLPEKENTYCPKCGECVIERIGYSVNNLLKGNKCGECGEVIFGRFSLSPSVPL